MFRRGSARTATAAQTVRRPSTMRRSPWRGLKRRLARLSVGFRRGLARHTSVYWLVIGVLTWFAWSSVSDHVRGLDAQTASLGTTVEVWVATDDVGRGELITAQSRQLPVAFAPSAAVTAFKPDLIARQSITAGEVIVAPDVAPGPAGLVPDDWVIVAVVESPVSGASRGDPVRVASGGMVIAEQGVVIGSSGDSTLVAVPADDGAIVAAANQQRDVALLRLPTG